MIITPITVIIRPIIVNAVSFLLKIAASDIADKIICAPCDSG